MYYSGPRARLPPTIVPLQERCFRVRLPYFKTGAALVSEQAPRGSSLTGPEFRDRNQPTHVAADPCRRAPIPGGEAPRECQASGSQTETGWAKQQMVGVDPRLFCRCFFPSAESSDKEMRGRRGRPMHHFRPAPAAPSRYLVTRVRYGVRWTRYRGRSWIMCREWGSGRSATASIPLSGCR